MFDVPSARERIAQMNLSESEKTTLEESFLDLAKDNQLVVNDDGSVEIKNELESYQE